MSELAHECAAQRKFVPPRPGQLPHEVAHSPMKPLNTEVSHRVGMTVTLFAPQRITWPGFVDLSKLVRPLRAKNLVKKTKYRELEDLYHHNR